MAIDIACKADSAWGPPATRSDVAVIPSDKQMLESDPKVKQQLTKQCPEQSLEARGLWVAIRGQRVNDQGARAT